MTEMRQQWWCGCWPERWSRELIVILALLPTLGQAATDPIDKPIITPDMFSYLGSFQLPEQANGWSTAFSNGGFSMRYVNGQLQFFTTSHVYSGGLLYEFNYPGIARSAPYPRASVITSWGDIYSGQKVDNGNSTLGGGCFTYGLLYDPSSQGIYWTYGDWYNTAAPFNPSIGYSRLDDATHSGSGIGAWSLSNRPEHMERGGVTRIPTWFADRFTGGNTLAVGFGGYYSIIGSGSLGAALATIPDPNLSGAADDSALPNTPLLGYQPAGGSGFGTRTPDYINRVPPGPWNGTIHSVGTTSFTTQSLLKSTGSLIDSTVLITSGPDAGDMRDITAWDYASQTATMATAWATTPVAGQSTYQIIGGFARAATANTITLKATSTHTDYTGQYLIISSGTGSGQNEQLVTAWDQATQTATVSPGWGTLPDATSQYENYTIGFGGVPDPAHGVGYWTWCDSIGGGVWIDTPDRQGLLTISLLGTGHVYYQASNIFSDGNEFEWEAFSPKLLSQVSTGALSESQVLASSIWIDPTLPAANPGTLVGGATFDPLTNRLYVLIEEVWKDGVEYYPQVYVYQLAGPLAGTTSTGTSSSSGGASTTSSGTSGAGGTATPPGASSSHGHRCGLGVGLSVLSAVLVAWRRRSPHLRARA